MTDDTDIGATPGQMRRAGLYVPPEPSPLEREHAEQVQAKLEQRGKPHGLSAAQVRAADEGGLSLASYAALRTCRTAADFAAVREQERIDAEARRQLAVADRVEEIRAGKG
jgi:hypothetical protein